jgi:hypothetical protein
MTRFLSLAMVALALCTSTMTAKADEAQRIAVACIEAMDTTAQNHERKVRETTGQTVNAVKRLDREGAPDRAIIAAGMRGIKEVDEATARATNRVKELRERCVRELRDLEAPRELIERVLNASRGAVASIEQSDRRAKSVIRNAVDEALN